MPRANTNDVLPAGFQLQYTLQGHKRGIIQIAWSPDGHMLASISEDETIRLWEADTGRLIKTLSGQARWALSVAWSPDGQTLAVGGGDGTIRFWDIDTGQLLRESSSYFGAINSIAWSPDGNQLAAGCSASALLLWDIEAAIIHRRLRVRSQYVLSVAWSLDGQKLASGGADGAVQIWEAKTGELYKTLGGYSKDVNSVVWSPDGRTLAAALTDTTIVLWELETGQQVNLEGHTDSVTCISFSHDRRLLASTSLDGTIRIWRYHTWENIEVLNKSSKSTNMGVLAFHPNKPVLAILSQNGRSLRILSLNPDLLLDSASVIHSVRYTNAKVVLVGDSGVGKSGLGLVLSGQPYAPTDSTHGRRVWIFDSQEIELDSSRKETRETLLWDLAGQPGYRLTHQLHLNEVAVALVVFDARSETDPFAGVKHWDRALRQARRIQDDTASPLKKLLVSARIDRGSISVSQERIEAIVRDFGYNGYFNTSAKEGLGIADLIKAIHESIDWGTLPKVSSTELFQKIKDFLITEKESGHLLSTAAGLYRTFLKSGIDITETIELRAQFNTCIGRVESRGLIRRLSFGNLVLLQPELLDAYASALVNAARDEPDGLGYISEDKARSGEFYIPNNEGVEDKDQETLLLIATIRIYFATRLHCVSRLMMEHTWYFHLKLH